MAIGPPPVNGGGGKGGGSNVGGNGGGGGPPPPSAGGPAPANLNPSAPTEIIRPELRSNIQTMFDLYNINTRVYKSVWSHLAIGAGSGTKVLNHNPTRVAVGFTNNGGVSTLYVMCPSIGGLSTARGLPVPIDGLLWLYFGVHGSLVQEQFWSFRIGAGPNTLGMLEVYMQDVRG